jgi:hypothetical protein
MYGLRMTPHSNRTGACAALYPPTDKKETLKQSWIMISFCVVFFLLSQHPRHISDITFLSPKLKNLMIVTGFSLARGVAADVVEACTRPLTKPHAVPRSFKNNRKKGDLHFTSVSGKAVHKFTHMICSA